MSRRVSRRPALSALRELLVEENSQVFQNPRDPTSTNITRAFINYDRDRSSSYAIRKTLAIFQHITLTHVQ